MLVSTAAASGARRAPRLRTTLIVVAAVLAGLVGTGTAALALGGDAWFGGDRPAVSETQTPTVEPSAQPSATATAPPTATPPPAPSQPVVRVPATCDDLAGVHDAENILELPLTRVEYPVTLANASAFSDQRVGSLSCVWSGDGEPYTTQAGDYYDLRYTIVPGVTDSAYELYTQGEAWVDAPSVPSLSPDALGQCGGSGLCTFIDHVNGYGLFFTASLPSGSTFSDDQVEQLNELTARLDARVHQLPAPEPLWQPAGATLAGADSCDDFTGTDTLDRQLGVTGMRTFKSDGGEYAASLFHSSSQVHAFWCSWSTDEGPRASATASVLPGGAVYFDQFRVADPSFDWQPTPGYAGEAFTSSKDGIAWLSVVVDDGWVMIQSDTTDHLAAIAPTILANVGAR
ncbi:hypothetical protein C5B96_04930 [Subtercola sp. Z020]|uniref:hypothetical protein n=1 Tax=Subtercola sp. Z020 TaxID=2080582 RepID=UPI000CE80DC1|nr:hypothetical protein [Subtercola sp. Z020]PPF86258.1 hypothetical protein C5B96_04930 [Subtercola sp. Z020]